MVKEETNGDSATVPGTDNDVLKKFICEGENYFNGIFGEQSRALGTRAVAQFKEAQELIKIRKMRERTRCSVLAGVSRDSGYANAEEARRISLMHFRKISADPDISKSEKKAEFARVCQLYNREEQLFNQHIKPIIDSGLHEESDLNRKISAILSVSHTASMVLGRRVIMRMLSRVSRAEGLDFASSIRIDRGAVERLMRNGYDVKELRNDISDFYQLNSGKLGAVRICDNGSLRANALVFNQTINIDDQFNRMSLFHELGHTLEINPVYREVGRAFIQNRKVSGGVFHDDYIQREYRDGCTEVLAMGMQELATASRLSGLFYKDPQLLYLTLGICVSV